MSRTKKIKHLCKKCKKDCEWLYNFGGYGVYKYADTTIDLCEECFEKECLKQEKIFKKRYVANGE